MALCLQWFAKYQLRHLRSHQSQRSGSTRTAKVRTLYVSDERLLTLHTSRYRYAWMLHGRTLLYTSAAEVRIPRQHASCYKTLHLLQFIHEQNYYPTGASQ